MPDHTTEPPLRLASYTTSVTAVAVGQEIADQVLPPARRTALDALPDAAGVVQVLRDHHRLAHTGECLCGWTGAEHAAEHLAPLVIATFRGHQPPGGEVSHA